VGLQEFTRALLGISTYQPRPRSPAPDQDSEELARSSLGGALAPLPQTKTRWILKDLEDAQWLADTGDLTRAAQLARSSKTDGVVMGVLSTRTGGLVRLPKRFRGDPEIIEQLEFGHDSVRSIFDEQFPPQELSALAADGVMLGVGVAELVPVPGRSYPVMVRLDPEWLYYRRDDGCWYYRSIAGPIPVIPGDGRWILHMPGGRVSPWHSGCWRAVGRAFINKEAALLYDQNWMGKLANPARVAMAPQGSTEDARVGWHQKVMAWGVNTVFSLNPGWEVKLLESNGVGSEAFNRAVERAEREIVIALAGQTVTTDGGTGFANADIHKSIRADLIKQTADDLAYTINTQGIPQFVVRHWGEEALQNSPCVEWDVTPPQDRKADAEAQKAKGEAIKGLTDSLARYGYELDIAEFMASSNIPIRPTTRAGVVPMAEVSSAISIAKDAGIRPTSSAAAMILAALGIESEPVPSDLPARIKLDLAPTDVAKAVKLDEVRASQGLPAVGGEEGDQWLAEVGQTAPEVSPPATVGENSANG
jgi:hypothetical protein